MILAHALYVGFVFAVLLGGALVFRLFIDRREIRLLEMGEDRTSYVDGAVACLLACCSLVLIPVFILCFSTNNPTVYIYALPIVLTMQLIQLLFRFYFQRTLVKTKGILVQSMLRRSVGVAPFDDIVVVRFLPAGVWVNVRLSLPNNEVVFRIFSFSAPSLERLLGTACTAPVLWLKKKADEKDRKHTNDPYP